MKNLNPLMFLSLLILSSCATTQPDIIPDLAISTLPVLSLNEVKTREIYLNVVNERAVNIAAGNSKQVEEAVSRAIMDSLQRGGFKITPAKNSLDLTISDCESAANAKLECVRIVGTLTTPENKTSVQSEASNGFTRGLGKTLHGNVNKAYETVLTTLINGFEKKSSIK